jgi:hypothetical protein
MPLALSPALNEKRHQMAELSGTTTDKVLLVALALYGIASQAKIGH